MVLFAQKWLYSGKSDFIRAKVDVFGQVVVFGQKCFYSDKEVIFGQKRLYSGKEVVIEQKWLYSCQSGCILAKVVVFGQKWLYSCKSGCIRKNWL